MKWVTITDSKGNRLLINPKTVYKLKEKFNLDEQLAYLYKINTDKKLISA